MEVVGAKRLSRISFRRKKPFANDNPLQYFSAQDFEIKPRSLQVGCVLGKGNFSTVYKGKYKGNAVAIKKQEIVNTDLEKYLFEELKMLKSVDHPGLIRFHGASLAGVRTVLIVMEYLPGGDLRRLLKRDVGLGWKLRVGMAKSIAEAIAYLHENEVVHRDIKTENVLLSTDLKPKVIDLGFARKKDPSIVMTMCGTDEFMAPEVIFGMKYNEKADVFSFGVLLAELIVRKIPGKATGFLHRGPRDGFRVNKEELQREYDKLSDQAPASFALLSQECVSAEPGDRPSIAEARDWLEELYGEMEEDKVGLPVIVEEKILEEITAENKSLMEIQEEQEDEDEFDASFRRISIEGDDDSRQESQAERNRPSSLGAPSNESGTIETAIEDHTKAGKSPKCNRDIVLEVNDPLAKADPPRRRKRSILRRSLSTTKRRTSRALSHDDAAIAAYASKKTHDAELDGTMRKHVMKGYVIKQGGRIKTWRKRYMVLTEEGLVYFKSENDYLRNPTLPQGALLFMEMVSAPDQPHVADQVPILTTGRPNSLRVLTKVRRRYISCLSHADAEMWVKYINEGFKGWYERKNQGSKSSSLVK